jgi:hypothetical protein
MSSRDYPKVEEVVSGRFLGYNGYNEVYSKDRRRWEVVCTLIEGQIKEYTQPYRGKLKNLYYGFNPETGCPIPLRVPDFIQE